MRCKCCDEGKTRRDRKSGEYYCDECMSYIREAIAEDKVIYNRILIDTSVDTLEDQYRYGDKVDIEVEGVSGDGDN